MNSLINSIGSTYSYATNSYGNRFSAFPASSSHFGSSSSRYLDTFLSMSLQLLIFTLIKQQLNALFNGQSSGSQHDSDDHSSQKQSGDIKKSGDNRSNNHLYCHCPCNPDQAIDDLREHEAEPEEIINEEVQAVLDMIAQLQQQTALQSITQSSMDFNQYLRNSANDQQIIRSVYLNGGQVLEKRDSHFVVEDANKHRYLIRRGS